MKLKLAALLGSAALLMTGAAQAAVVTIDFETGVSGNTIGSDFAGLGATFTGGQYWTCGGGCPAPSNGHFASSSNFSSPVTVNFAALQTLVSFWNVTNSSHT